MKWSEFKLLVDAKLAELKAGDPDVLYIDFRIEALSSLLGEV